MASTLLSGLSHQESKIRVDLQKLRDLIRCYTDRHQLESALFWANKLVTLSKGDSQDVYSYANLLYLTGQYQRAIHQLKTFRLDRLLIGRYLTARCHFAAKDFQEALNVLDQIEGGGRTVAGSCTSSNNLHKELQGISTHNIASAIELLRGHVLEALENRSMAVECYREALMLDVKCFEALDCLIQHHMLTSFEEQQLLESLPITQQCSTEDAQLVLFCYGNILKKLDRTTEMTSPPQLVAAMAENSDVRVVTAEHHFHNCDFQLCYNVTSQLLSGDPYNIRCLPIHVGVLVELKKLNELFYLAHKLIDINPNSAVSWFAVGCYYLASNKHELARRYLSKSTSLNRVFGPAWIAYGHSFAAENEHDQAMAAYFTASQLMKGCHLPLLYVGLEYGLTNNSKLAERFFNQALLMAPESPFILHEIGVIAFQSQEYEKAEQYFLLALDKLQRYGAPQTVTVKKWEPLLNNLGHVSRKLKKYDAALNYHMQSLVLCPHNSSTLSAMGYVHALSGNFSQAVECFHKALGLKKDDTFSITMLNNTIEQLVSETQPVAELPGPLPKYQYHGRLGGGGEDPASHSAQQTTDLECSDELSLMSSSRRHDDSSSLLDAEMEEV